ncbi:hypothetical protein [Amycolatopsis sp. NPDC051061]|uniref:hypothetical protein n=1 Tax=Amycolatopsis sp. NPDC051061 TaxID=3155042 RepID=UPI003413720A
MRFSRMICTAAIGAAVALSTAGVAYASTPDVAGAQAPATHRVHSTMRSVGFDAEVAAAHGYEVRTAPGGQQYSVPKGTAAGNVGVFNIVTGKCGSSWVYVSGIGNAQVQLDTGFSVYANVVSRQWRVGLSDNGGTSTQNFSGGATGAISAWTRIVGGLTRGPGSAFIRSNGSNFAILTDGNVCYSAGPSDSTTIS